MKVLRSLSSAILLSCCLHSVLVGVSGLPQWVWNKDVVDSNRVGNSESIFAGHSTRFPSSAEPDPQKSNIRVVGGAPRLFTSNIVSAISNSIQGSGGGGGGGAGGLGGIFGTVLGSIPQLATSAIGGIFGRPSVSLPGKIPDFGSIGSGGSSGGGSSGSGATGACKCIDAGSCFLPSTQGGSCGGGRVQCCSGTRTVFPDEGSSGSFGSFSPNKGFTKNERTVTQREIRRGLLQQILKGSGSLVDDTLDLILTPYLSKDDQQRIATRVVDDE